MAVIQAASISENEKRNQIKLYFKKSAMKWPFMPISVLLIVLAIINGNFNLIFSTSVIAFMVFEFFRKESERTDEVIDMWFSQDIDELEKRSLERLNIDKSELIRDPLRIIGPILWDVMGVPSKEIAWKKGKDERARFSINSITIILITEHKLSCYQCQHNSMRGAPLNESDDEYYYKDVVAVSTRDKTTNYTLPNQVVMKQAQHFSLSVSSGDRIEVLVNSADILKLTGGEVVDTGLDSTIKAIRKVLDENKI